LRAELSELILRRVNDPRVRLATVNSVEVSPDLKRARVLLSVLGSDEEREACLEGLRHARGFLRSQLARGLRHMKAIPELNFELDTGAEYSQHISSILDSLEFHDESS
jgi:ribosome-binding factor A